ncbi:pyrroline-5-carboxylate reductase [Curtobacterium ammoniigenes]|uniref:pyrroline-5-carboxylate reductase n=1 Tax=Curtobacterium ammoniigenes TaxID=395387 RepID=UPI000ABECE2E|nr:pyrroline-5-carboxylate reductase [Curtobacterium ammoniigenes]
MTDDAMNGAFARTAFLGTGSMSGAILRGLLAAGAPADRFRATTRTAASAERLRALGVDASAVENDADANRAAVQGARLVVLGVKPFAVADLLREIADALEPNAIVVSVAVGIRSATMEALLPPSIRVVRALPNTPVAVGRGVTGLSAGARADPAAVDEAAALFSASGSVVRVEEPRLDALSAVSGSGPAYVFLLIEQWERAAVSLGFTPAEAAVLVQGTVRGAMELLAATESPDPAALRRAVTSPRGTTERAIAVLETADLESLLVRASEAAIARAVELAESN